MNCRWCFGPPLFVRDFAVGHVSWGVSLQLCANFVSRLSSAYFLTILLIFRVTGFTVVLHVAHLVSCHNFLIFLLCFCKWSRPRISHFLSKGVIFLVDCLYAEAIVTVKSHAALSASLEEWICIFGEMSSEERLWNIYLSVSFSNGFKASFILTGPRMLNSIDRWSDYRMSDSRTFCYTTMARTVRCAMRRTLWSWNFEVRTNK
jgi:hypothetical protein